MLAENDTIHQLQISQYVMASGLILLLYDHILTLSQEIELVWKARSSIGRTLFLILRYLPVLGLVFNTFVTSGRSEIHLSLEVSSYSAVCFALNRFMTISSFVASIGLLSSSVVSFFSLAISQFLALLRLWVIWDRDRRLMFWTGAGFFISQAGTFAANAWNFRAVYDTSYFDENFHSCYWRYKLRQWPQWLAFEIMVFFLTVYNALSKPRVGDKELTRQMYIDGSLYFIVLTVLRSGNLVLAVMAPVSLMLLTFFIWSVATIVTTRLILNCRQLSIDLRGQRCQERCTSGYTSPPLPDVPSSPIIKRSRKNTSISELSWPPVLEEMRMDDRAPSGDFNPLNETL
ncbi:hypothetical protein DL96DRAFT_1791037 [Flagelloscypha sp. PMI_526]|nr:hypothetical protein DL96DRAFT_1791037 [Flagelloscypha sp. PMI_526]